MNSIFATNQMKLKEFEPLPWNISNNVDSPESLLNDENKCPNRKFYSDITLKSTHNNDEDIAIKMKNDLTEVQKLRRIIEEKDSIICSHSIILDSMNEEILQLRKEIGIFKQNNIKMESDYKALYDSQNVQKKLLETTFNKLSSLSKDHQVISFESEALKRLQQQNETEIESLNAEILFLKNKSLTFDSQLNYWRNLSESKSIEIETIIVNEKNARIIHEKGFISKIDQLNDENKSLSIKVNEYSKKSDSFEKQYLQSIKLIDSLKSEIEFIKNENQIKQRNIENLEDEYNALQLKLEEESKKAESLSYDLCKYMEVIGHINQLSSRHNSNQSNNSSFRKLNESNLSNTTI